ncbi:MAG: AI-2E family transporter [Fimbriimonadales bacterium]|nr:MAG: AI-2E family transporter [Fimbriimonadales bacterium]
MERRTANPTADWSSRILWLLGTLALIALALYVVWSVRHVISLMFICGAIAYLLIPLADWLSSKRPKFIAPLVWRGVVSLTVTLGFLALGAFAIVAFITPFVSEARDFLRELPRYEERFRQASTEWQEAYEAWYNSLTPPAQQWLDRQRESLIRSLNRATDDLQTTIQGAIQQTGHVINIVVELFLVPVVVFYLLFDSHRLKRETLRWTPPRYVRLTLNLMQETNRVMRGYIAAQLILGVIAGVATWIGLQLMGVKYAATLAMFGGLARAIPVIGPVIAGAPIVLIGLIQGGLPLGLKLALFITALFIIEHKMIMPKIIGDRVDMHPVLVILVLLVSGKFFGLMGMFFGVPVAVIVRNVMLQQRRRTRPKIHQLTVLESVASAPTNTGTGGQ